METVEDETNDGMTGAKEIRDRRKEDIRKEPMILGKKTG